MPGQVLENYNQRLCRNNLFYLQLLSVFRALFFMVPVWVSMELRYISLTQVAIIDIIILLSALILELPTGALADLIGRKKSISIAFLITALAYFLFAYANSFTWFVVAALGFGLGDALLSGSLEALVFDTLKQNQQEHTFSEVNNKTSLIFNYSIFVAIVLGGMMYQHFPRLPSILTGCAMLISGLISLRLIEPDIDSEKFTLKNYLRQTKMGFKELFKNKQARDISVFYILVGAFTWPIVLSFKNFALVDLGVNEKNIGLILGFVSLFAVQILHLMIRKKVFDNMKIVFLLPSIILSIVLPLSYFYQIPIIILMVFFVALVSSMRWNVLGKLSNQCYSSKNRATAISSLSMMISLAYIAVLALFSLLNEYTEHSIRIIFLLMGLGSIFFLLPISWKLAKKYQDRIFVKNSEVVDQL
mgnify:FL=1